MNPWLNRLHRYLLQRIGKQPAHPVLQPIEVCVFPLPDVVLFPGIVLPLHIFEERYKMMIHQILKADLKLAMSWAKPLASGQKETSVICGAGSIEVVKDYPDGRKDLFVTGSTRLRLVDYIQKEPFIQAWAEEIEDIPFPSEYEERSHHRELALLTKRWIFLSPDLNDKFMEYVNLFGRAHHLADCVAHYFWGKAEEKQKLLEIIERKKRVESVILYLQKQIHLLEENPPRHPSTWAPLSRSVH